MFARISTVFMLFFLALCVSATAVVPRGGGGGGNQCTTGSLQCCNSVENVSSDPLIGILEALLGVVVGSITGVVGLTCTSIVGGNSCTAQTACCTGNNFSGLIVVGCSPINIGL